MSRRYKERGLVAIGGYCTEMIPLDDTARLFERSDRVAARQGWAD